MAPEAHTHRHTDTQTHDSSFTHFLCAHRKNSSFCGFFHIISTSEMAVSLWRTILEMRKQLFDYIKFILRAGSFWKRMKQLFASFDRNKMLSKGLRTGTGL